MFSQVAAVPPDPILGLAERFGADPNPGKLDLTAGVYKDETGTTPIFASVIEAQRRHLASETTKAYLPIAGPGEFASAVESLVFSQVGGGTGDRARTAETPGGTGALAVVARLLAQTGGGRVWIPDPTWPNHRSIFEQTGLEVATYGYYREQGRQLTVDRALADLAAASPGDTVLLHGCCHNPSGRDLGPDDWPAFAALLAGRGLVGLVALAYLGLAEGLTADAAFLDTMVGCGADLIVCSSFSKNMGLYRERVGALSVVAPDSGSADNVLGNVKKVIRSLYSNPPAFGGAVASTVLGDEVLRAQWVTEVDAMRRRLNTIRQQLAEAVADAGLDGFAGMETERGMFTLTGLTAAEAEWLRVERGVYVLDSGRANVAGLSEADVGRFVSALADVLVTGA